MCVIRWSKIQTIPGRFYARNTINVPDHCYLSVTVDPSSDGKWVTRFCSGNDVKSFTYECSFDTFADAKYVAERALVASDDYLSGMNVNDFNALHVLCVSKES